MIDITTDAIKNILAYFGDDQIKPIRVFMNAGGWGGGGIAMALDEPKENDYKLEKLGIIIVADKDFLKETGTITIDWTGMGFNLKSENQLVKATGKCGGCTEGSCWNKEDYYESRIFYIN